MSARDVLLSQLDEEIAQGWPTPFHDQDRLAILPHDHHHRVLEAYIGLIADALCEPELGRLTVIEGAA